MQQRLTTFFLDCKATLLRMWCVCVYVSVYVCSRVCNQMETKEKVKHDFLCNPGQTLSECHNTKLNLLLFVFLF